MKKILALCLVVVLVATAITGVTLAYFTDTDAQTNTFTVGNVKIDLFEDFNTDALPLVPAVGSTDPETNYATYENTIEKEVYIENEGTEESYVRVYIAIPAIKEGANVIDLLRDEYSTVDGKWNWGTTPDANYPPRDGGDWAFYKKYTLTDEEDNTTTQDIVINEIPYKIFCVTYESILKTGDVTVDAINKVFMDPATTNEEITAWDTLYGEDAWAKVYVVAEAVQADGFENAFEALNAAFGVPGTYVVNFNADAEGDTFKEATSMDGN